MNNPLQSKHIILGVTGSIACYKAADLASKMTQAGAQVDVLLTAGATQFITPLTFQSVTGRRAFTDADLWGHEAHVIHVGLGHSTDLVVVAPITANTMAKLAHGIADNLLTVTALAANCPLLIAPAMDGGMFSHPATQANLETLRQRGAYVVGPAEGHLASGLAGIGRMVEPVEILGQVRRLLAQGGPLAGRKVVVTAGGTQEAIDPVRSITNRSSGKQGFSLAQAALDLGAEVTLIAGNTSLPTPYGARRVDVRSAQEMLTAVLTEIEEADALLMAAAVADFRPAAPAGQKIKKEAGPPEIRLENTPDILTAVAGRKAESRHPRITVGFAAESQNLLENARGKVKRKKLDLMVANDITARDAGFAVDTNRVTLIDASGATEQLPLMSKDEVAAVVLEKVLALLGIAAQPEESGHGGV
ncbi:MAG: bifunctional phosphopantothenoylcysteine decarboxylase/phosphopantothenate--cysteine ligase CoaBC [Chloroflexota bacterium]|nr:MAG: bifunctional phosphopantothenoylcysteine decarboxylase/phosphopantothenate--cysteine ligase CoaBC [Chloroflexota bacterium]